MKKKVIACVRSPLILTVAFCAMVVSLGPVSMSAAQSGSPSGQPPDGKRELGLPHLRKVGATSQMIVNGRPYLMLAGELHNSSASSSAYMQPIWAKLADDLHLNTVISTVSW